jgi:hypothetical protein
MSSLTKTRKNMFIQKQTGICPPKKRDRPGLDAQFIKLFTLLGLRVASIDQTISLGEAKPEILPGRAAAEDVSIWQTKPWGRRHSFAKCDAPG